MEEKVLMKNVTPDTKKFLKTMMIIGLVLALVTLPIRFTSIVIELKEYREVYRQHQEAGSCFGNDLIDQQCQACAYIEDSALGAGLRAGFDVFIACFVVFMAVMVVAFLIILFLTSFSLVVTDKRVYCKILWIHHICLPVDSITAVARIGIINVLAIGAPAGRIHVWFLDNSKEFYDVLNNLLIARQEKALKEMK